MIVVFTAVAESDLEEIGDWIAQDNPMRAVTFVKELSEACLSLADAPRASPLFIRVDGIEFRRKIHRNYLIFYRIVGDTIEISHVLHGARDYLKILLQDLE